jgi:hypothetical protein
MDKRRISKKLDQSQVERQLCIIVHHHVDNVEEMFHQEKVPLIPCNAGRYLVVLYFHQSQLQEEINYHYIVEDAH